MTITEVREQAFRYFRKYVDHHTAEDWAQDFCLRYETKIKSSLANAQKKENYLRRAISNFAIDKHRSKSRDSRSVKLHPYMNPLLGVMEEADVRRDIQLFAQTLSEKYRAVLELLLAGLQCKDIARVLSLSKGCIAKRLRVLRAKWREYYDRNNHS